MLKLLACSALCAANFAMAGVAEAAPLISETLTINTTGGSFSITSLPLPAFSDTFTGYVKGFGGFGTGYFRYDAATNDLAFQIQASKFGYFYCEVVCGRVDDVLISETDVHPTTPVQVGSSFTLSPDDVLSVNNVLFLGQIGYDTYYLGDPLFVTGVSFTVAATPLPASAPLFGAALLALAGLGYGAKRRKSAAAA